MKQIIIALALMLGVSASAQSKKDLARHAGAPEVIEKFIKGTKCTDLKQGFVLYRLYGLQDVVTLTEQQNKDFYKFFEAQYEPLQEAYKKFKETGSIGSKTELIKLIVKNEEDFRNLLPKDQLMQYIKYGYKIVTTIPYADNYLNDDELERYKKNL